MKFNHSLRDNHQSIQQSGVKTRNQIADEYGIHVRTLHRWIKKYGINIPPGALTPFSQQRIYDVLGAPSPKQDSK